MLTNQYHARSRRWRGGSAESQWSKNQYHDLPSLLRESYNQLNSVKYAREFIEMPTDSKIVLKTCRLLVSHFRNCLEYGNGFHSRLFSHILHPEDHFVFAGKSVSVRSDTPTHPEHVVPCAFMIEECRRLIKDGISDELIATLLEKHWKVAVITKEEQKRLDYQLGLKSTMPSGWRFEDGDTFKRFELAEIRLLPEA